MNWSVAGAILMALAVAFGAFGAHGLRARLDAYSMGVYEKAVFYHFIHALGILIAGENAAGLLAAPGRHRAILRQPVSARRHRQPEPGRDHTDRRPLLHRGLGGLSLGPGFRPSFVTSLRAVGRAVGR